LFSNLKFYRNKKIKTWKIQMVYEWHFIYHVKRLANLKVGFLPYLKIVNKLNLHKSTKEHMRQIDKFVDILLFHILGQKRLISQCCIIPLWIQIIKLSKVSYFKKIKTKSSIETICVFIDFSKPCWKITYILIIKQSPLAKKKKQRKNVIFYIKKKNIKYF
jgi:hypothetical protein